MAARRQRGTKGRTRGLLYRAGVTIASFLVIVWSGLFDREWYGLQVSRRIWRLPLLAVLHYVVRGRRLGMSPHPLFEPEFFDPPTWRDSAADPFAKYLRGRARSRRRSPHPLFDSATYLDRAPEAAADRRGPLGHFFATAGPDTSLPVAPVAGRVVTVTWGAAKEHLLGCLRRRNGQERLRRAPRVSRRYDRRLERRFLRQWGGAPSPAALAGAPLVSVVLPVWNRQEQVRAAIASVRSQILHDWELLVVDDGSTDESAAVVASIAADDPRVRLLSQPHAGVSRARNLGLQHARGRYVAFLDSDNTYRPCFLRTAVAAMYGMGWRAAYAAMQIRNGDVVRYRALRGGQALLDLRNHIDLNVLVVERDLLEQVGGFDERLRRAVDYDLILRLSAVSPIEYLPFVAADYDRNDEDPNRLTVREPLAWLEVVQNKHLVDWAAASRSRAAGRVSVLVTAHEEWQVTCRCVESVLAEIGQDDVEVLLLDNGSRRSVGAILAAFAVTDPRIRLVREPLNRNVALGRNLAFARSTGEIVVFLNNAEVRPGWLKPLLQALDNRAVLAAQPLLLSPNGTVQCAGVCFPARGRGIAPLPFLAHHPVEDAHRLGPSFDVSAVSGAAVAMQASDVAALHGFDPIYRCGWEALDLSLRLRQLRPGTLVVRTDSAVVCHTGQSIASGRDAEQSATVFRERWSGRTPGGDEGLWQAAGFSVSHYRTRRPPGNPDVDGIVEPVLSRSPHVVAHGPAKGLPALRWAIKTASPPGEAGLHWGDVHFAQALGAALERLGQIVVVDSRAAQTRNTAYLDDVVLVLRGLTRVEPQPGRVNLLWIISHPDLVDVDEIRTYDGVFAASAPWAARMTEQAHRPVDVLLQCTDPERFQPGLAQPDTGEEVLFIGNSRNVFRPIMRDALAAGADVSVYGKNWERFIDERLIRGTYFPNELLATAYRSAGVVLNDHWEDMRREGFISNRVFDATAAGARVVSDEVPLIEETFGGLVRTYCSVEELRHLLIAPRDEVFPSEEERLLLAERVRQEHSFDARARSLFDAASAQWKV